MEKEAQAIRLLQGLAQSGRGQIFFTANVKSIEGNTCTIEIDENFSVSDVRLKPTTDQLPDDIILTPAIGSSVLVGSLSGDFSNLFILQADTISEAVVKIGAISLKIDKNGIVANDGNNDGVVNIGELMAWQKNVAADMAKIATGLAAVPYTFVPATQAPVRAKLEDTKLKH